MAKIGDDIKEAMISHAKGHIDKHKMNVMIYFRNAAGIGGEKHPDVLEAISERSDVVTSATNGTTQIKTIKANIV